MKLRPAATLSVVLLSAILILRLEAKGTDPYKVLGVDKNASQRDIQKAFHKLSLKYHPDKNKDKAAQTKFEEINNAYEILSDEEKRKNYDTYGDEKGNPGPGFGAGYPGDQGGYSYFTNGGPGRTQFTSGPGGWQDMGGQGSKTFSFSFGGSGGGRPSSFGVNMDDIFSGFFGNQGGFGGFGGFGGSRGSQSRNRTPPKTIREINSQIFKKEIVDQGMTWLLLSCMPSLDTSQYYEVMEEAANSLQGALKVGQVNCETESSLCKELGIQPRRAPRLFVYSYKASEKGSLEEYDNSAAKSVAAFCKDRLPRFSKRINLNQIDFSSGNVEKLPRVALLSTKKDTPVIWRVLSGLYHKRFSFYDVEVHDVSDPSVKNLGVDALPAIVGWLSNGEKHVLKSGVSVKDLKSAIQELSALLDSFEKKNKKVASAHASKQQSGSMESQIPLLTSSNFNSLCGEKTPVCIFGVFKSSKSKEKLESFLSQVSQKSLSRRQNTASTSSDTVSYSLVDASKQSSFLNSFQKSGFKSSSDAFLIAYKPKREKFAAFEGDMTLEEVEGFISSVLNGDVQFNKTRQKPVLR